MKTLIALMALVGSTAFADGFVCYTKDSDLKIKLLNHIEASQGTRTGSVMIISDQTIQDGNKTSLVFSSEDENLSTVGTQWTGSVVKHTKGAEKAGRNLAGTKVGFIDSFIVDVVHFYDMPVASGTKLDGILTVVKTDGSQLTEDLNCYRYRKN